MKITRCARIGCRKRPGMPEIALCRWCGLSHCGRHRLPEGHKCLEIQKCRDVAFEGNRVRLEAAKCAPSKLQVP
jgi:predicted nucleic acid binding AN1-type Zn finger protein